ncbi:MAG: hypothetical protein E7L25_02640 [Varibaculum cambriense]|nr:hypothetical protein [Varibaculum cambriense]
MADLFDRAALLKAEKLTRLSLPAGALDHISLNQPRWIIEACRSKLAQTMPATL